MQLLNEPYIRTIFGKIEIATIKKKLQNKKLKQTEKNYLSRSIRPKLIAANALHDAKLLQAIQGRRKTDEYHIIYNLSEHGYPLMAIKKKKTKILKTEQLIIEILTKYQKARYIEAIPILLLKNPINAMRLLDLASRYEVKNIIGYLLETASLLQPLSKELQALLHYLKKNKEEKNASLAQRDNIFLERTSTKRIKQWHLLGRFFDDDWKKLGEIYL
jgi:hypothetical protein